MKSQLNLNWRLVVIHGLVFWCIAVACQTFAWFGFADLIDVVRKAGTNDQARNFMQEVVSRDENATASIAYFLLVPAFAGHAGMLLALCLAILLSKRKGWPIQNTIAGLVLTLLFRYYGPDIALSNAFFHIGKLSPDTRISIIVTGTLLLVIGLLLLYSRPVIRFIESAKGWPNDQPEVETPPEQ